MEYKELTANEKEMIKNITEDCFYEGPESPIWTNTFLEEAETELTVNQMKGVLSSLSKKGILLVTDETIEFTEEGMKLI